MEFDIAAPIEITARRIADEPGRVSASVLGVAGDDLAARNIERMQDLHEAVPGLFVSAPNARLASFYLRGLGTYPFNAGLESSVALFQDGVYLGRTGMAAGDLLDVARIEVARGPQGALYGKNASAGAISVFTRPPAFTPEAALQLGGGSHGLRELNLNASGPLAATLAGRLSLYSRRRDGLVENHFDGARLNDLDRAGVRGQLLWTPDDAFALRVIAEAGEADEACCTFPLLGAPRAAVAASDAFMGYARVTGDPAARVTDTDAQPSNRVRQRALTADARWTPAPGRQLTSLTAARHYDFRSVTDDNTSMALVNGGTTERHRQWSQEFRYDARGETFDTTAGLYWLDQTTTGSEDATLGADLADWVFGGTIRRANPFATRANTSVLLHPLLPPATLAGMRVVTPFSQHTTSFAPYGAATWHASERLDLSAGLRWTVERKRTRVTRSRTGGNPAASPLAFLPDLSVLSPVLGVPLAGVTFSQFLDDTVGGAFARDQGVDEIAWSGQLGASWRFTPDLTGYLSAARGVKSGGVNLGVTGVASDPVFRPEIADSVEAGLKLRGFDERLQLNLAVYAARVRDYQAVSFDESPTFVPNPRLNNVLNVERVSLAGVELDFAAALPGQVNVAGGLAYNRAVTDVFTNAPDEDSQQNTRDLSGQPLANAPRWQGNLAVRKTWRMAGQLNATLGADYWFRSGYNATIERSRATEFAGYGVAGLQAGLAPARGDWTLALWAKNLADTDYVAAVVPLYGVGAYGAYAGEPRTFGVTLTLRLR